MSTADSLSQITEKQLITIRRLRLYAESHRTVLPSFLAGASTMAAIASSSYRLTSILAWIFALSFAYFLRIYHMRWYEQNHKRVTDYSCHQLIFILTFFLTGSGWALAVAYFGHGMSATMRDIVYLLAGVTTAFSVVTASASLSYFLAFNIPIASAVLYCFIMHADTSNLDLLGIVIFYLLALILSNHLKNISTQGIKLELENEDLSASKEASRAELENIKKVFRSIPDAIAIIQFNDGSFVTVNDSACSISGYRRAEFTRRTIFEMGFWYDAAEQEKFVSKLKKHKLVREFQARLVCKSGELRDCELTAEIVKIDGTTCVICAIRDNTEKQQAERALRESEIRFGTIFDSAPNGIAIGDAYGRFLIVNRKFCEMLGYQEIDLIGRNIGDISTDENQASNSELLNGLSEGAIRGYRMEKQYVHKSGKPLWLQLSASRIDDENGALQFTVLHASDVSSRKKTEIELEKRQLMFERSESLGGVGHWEWDEVEEKLTYCSKQYAEILELTVEEALSLADSEEGDLSDVHPDDVDFVRRTELACYNSATPFDFEYRIITRSGKTRYVHQLGNSEFNSEGKVVRSFGTLQDITERKMAELERLQRASMFERAERLGKIGHWEWDELTNRLSSCSPEYLRIYGLKSMEDITSGAQAVSRDYRYVHPEDKARLKTAELESIKNASALNIEFRITDANGNLRYLHQLGDVETDQDGKVIRSFGTVQDITDNKLIELEINKRNQMFEAAEKLGSLGHWEWDEINDCLISCSDEYANIFGLDRDSLIQLASSYEGDLSLTHKDDIELRRSAGFVWRAGELPLDLEYRIVRPDGEIRHVHQKGDIEFDQEGNSLRSYGTLQDITVRKLAELELKEQQRRSGEAEKLGRLGHWEWDEVEDKLVYASEEFARIHGQTVQECLARSTTYKKDLDTIHPEDRKKYEQFYNDVASKSEVSEIQYRLLNADGNIRHVHEITRTVFDNSGKIIRYVGTTQDISEQHNTQNELRKSQRQFKHTFNSAPIGMALVELDGTIIEINHAASRMLGYSKEDSIGMAMSKLTHSDEYMQSKERLQKLSSGEIDNYNVIRRFRHSSGEFIWVDLHCNLIRENDGTPIYLIVQGIDITEQRTLSDKLRYQASHDSLTDLINRREFEKRLNKMIESAHSRAAIHTFCYMDLDQFKLVNDTFGHAAGDELLRQLCGLIQSGIRSRDTLARLGGDEFGLLMEHCQTEDALLTAENLRNSINDFRFVWNDTVLSIGVSMGIVVIDHNAGTSDDLLKAADNACYMAKEQGRNRIKVYTESDEETTVRQSEMKWATRINHAIRNDDLFLVAQPIIELSNEKKPGGFYELLLRIRNNKGELISGSALLSAAERFGLITNIDKWVIKKACSTILSNTASFEKIALCSINLSGRSITDMEFLEYIEKTVDAYNIPPSKICFEITETAAISNFSNASKFMEKLRARGFYFALDDFGTGLSSFNYLKKLPVDYVKIDGSFIRDILKDQTDMAMVKSINELGHVFGKRTIAEYVESEEILEKVKALGIDFAQGYSVGMPAPIASNPELKIVK